MLVPLSDADLRRCGGKAATLGTLRRAGIHVPDGLVVPVDTTGSGLIEALRRELGELATTPLAVRSSATTEDMSDASAAGQYESVLGVRGIADVAAAVEVCRASLRSARAQAYHTDASPNIDETAMPVLIQRLVDADISGVMFTPTHPGGDTRIEASWGLGSSTAGGTVTPDAYAVAADGTVRRTVAHKLTRIDRHGAGLRTRSVPPGDRARPALADTTAARLATLGSRIARVLGAPQDVEWAITGTEIWILQARPITAALPASRSQRTGQDRASQRVLTGAPGSHGIATGPARVVLGPEGFARVRPGDILVCPTTDPAWTPLLRVAAAVVTDVGGVLSHAAIVARERGIPAVLGIPGATTQLRDGDAIIVDGGAGTVTLTDP